jgi:hypothetical protein
MLDVCTCLIKSPDVQSSTLWVEKGPASMSLELPADKIRRTEEMQRMATQIRHDFGSEWAIVPKALKVSVKAPVKYEAKLKAYSQLLSEAIELATTLRYRRY